MKDDLEKLIDAHGLSKVLASIGEICHEKADHVATNWQDVAMSNQWSKAARRIDQTASHYQIQSVSGKNFLSSKISLDTIILSLWPEG